MTIDDAIARIHSLKIPITISTPYPISKSIETNTALDMAITALRAQQELETLRKERDAAIADIYRMGGCPNCKFNAPKNERTGFPICDKKREYPNGECFEWRGVQPREIEKPITAEELREMGGKPYYHVSLPHRRIHWKILDPEIAAHIEDYGYGESWLAYHRPPEL